MPIRKTVLAAMLTTMAVPALYIAATPAAAQTLTRAENYVESAQVHFDEGRIEQAASDIKSALTLQPNNADARFMLGRILFYDGDITGALKELGRAHTLNPSDDTAVMLAEAMLQSGKAEDALRIMNGPGANLNGTVRRLTITGVANAFLNRFDAAEAAYRKILTLDSKRVEGYFGLAQVYNARKEYSAAAKQLAEITAARPDFAAAWSLSGEVAMSRGMMTEAFEAFDQAIALMPDSPWPMVARARANLTAGRLAKAKADAEAVEQLTDNSPIAHYLQSAIAYAEGDIDRANRSFTHLQRNFDNFAPAVLLGALVKQRKGELNQSGSLFLRYIEMQPESIDARRALAAVRLSSDQPRNALDMLDVVLWTNPEDAESLHRKASAYVGIDRYAQATRLYRQLATVGSPEQRQLAVTALGFLDPSQEQLSDPALGNANVRQTLAKAFDRLSDGDGAQAKRLLETLEFDNSPSVLSLRGQALAKLGEYRTARRFLERALDLDPERIDAVTTLAALDRRQATPSLTLPRLKALLDKRPRSETLTQLITENLETKRDTEALVGFLTQQRDAMAESPMVSRMLVNALMQHGERQAAVAETQRLVRLSPTDADILTFAARIFTKSDAAQLAVEAVEQLQRLSPDDAEIPLKLAIAQGQAGQIDAARATLRNAGAKWPENTAIATARIRLEIAAEQSDAVEAIIRERRAINPLDAARLSIFAGVGDGDAALEQLETGFAAAPDSRLAVDLFEARRRLGRDEQAFEAMTRWVESNPADREANEVFANALLQIGRYDRAERTYENVIALDPNDVTALNNYAWLRHQSNRNDALEYARRAFDLAGDRPEIADTYGWMLVSYGKLKEGLAVLRKASALAPDNPEISLHLATALSKAGLRDEARSLLSATLQTQPGFPGREEAEALLLTLAEG